jgi:hypothetical protein
MLNFEDFSERVLDALQIPAPPMLGLEADLYDEVGLDSLQAFQLIVVVESLAGTAVHIQGNNNATVPLPTGTFTQYLLIVAEVTTASGNAGFLPLLNPGSGFTLITSDSAAPPPNFAVYESATGTIDPVLTGNDTKGRWTAVVLGFTTGTTVTNSPIAGSPTSPITVTGVSATSNSTWVFVGSASDGVGPTNWVTPSGFTKIVDIDGNNDTPPDLFVAQYNVLTTTAPATTAAFGATDSAKAILIGVG